MKYSEIIAKLEAFPRFDKRERLSQLRNLLCVLGDPQKNLRFVHVTGTNGKGSTCALTESVLRAAGYKTGLFTSPHVHSYTERIRVNGNSISEEEFALYGTRVLEAMEEYPTFEFVLFDFFVLLSLLVFSEKKVDLVVFEVGIGGRLDSTNVVDAELAVLTNVALEHTQVLGATLEEVALQKLGIVKEGATLVTTEKNPQILRLAEQFVETQKAQLKIVQEPFEGPLSLRGDFQKWNAALVLGIVEVLRKRGWKISNEALQYGLKTAVWPLRMQIFQERPLLLMDGAHNLHAIESVMEEICGIPVLGKRIAIVGLSYDKAHAQILQKIATAMDTIILTESSFHAEPAEQLARFLEGEKLTVHIVPDSEAALNLAKALAKEDDAIFVLGSLYLAADLARLVGEWTFGEGSV